MGAKNQTSTATSAPNPAAMSAYTDILNKAQTLGNSPYTPYGGELVPGVNAQQTTGINNINSSAGIAQPYIQQAAGLATAASTPLTAAQIQQYQSPYTQSVVNATQAQFNNQNAQQLQGVKGNAIAQGALGGNREAVAEAETTNQQQLAQAPVIAGLENQGYQTGLNTALAEQQAQAQGAYSLGNLGVSGQNAALTGANAQVGAGNLQYGVSSAADQAAYGQFQNQQAFPYQQLQWQAGIDTGVGSNLGGTTTTTSPGPSALGQAAGLGTSVIGGLGASGAFGAAGWLAPAMLALADGGRVGLATGGGVSEGDSTAPESHDTLVAQQHQLMQGHRRVQMFPKGTPELPVPHGMGRTETDKGAFHYDPRKIDAGTIKALSGRGRENELLDLGPVSKAEAMARVQRGEHPVAIVERKPDGTEVRTAVGTHVTAPHQLAAMHRTKSPGNTLHVEDPRATLASRQKRADGGRIQGLAMGGVPYNATGMPYGGGTGYIPSMQITHGRGAPPAPGMGNQNQGASPSVGMLKFNNQNGPLNLGTGYTPSAVGDSTGLDVMPSAPSSGDAIYYRGGGVHVFADGGTPQGLAGIPDWLSDAQYTPSPSVAPDSGDMPAGFSMNDDTLALGVKPNWDPEQEAALADVHRSQAADNGGLPPEITQGHSGPIDAAPNRALAYNAPAGIAPAQPDYAGVDDPDSAYNRSLVSPRAPTQSSATSDLAYEHPHTDPWGAMIAAGLGMMASRSPFAGVAIGEGGLAGLKEYSAEQAQNIAEAEKKTNLAQSNKRIDLESTRLDQAAKQAQDQLNLKTKEQSEGSWYQQQEAAKPVVVRQDVDQFEITHPVYGKRAPDGTFVDPVTGKPIDPPAIDPMNSSSKGAPGTQVASADGTFTPEPGDLAGRNPEVLSAHPDLANTIKAIDEGRMNLGSVGFKQRTMLAQLVNQYDPSWDQSTWAARNKQQSDLTTNGNAGKMLLAVNQLLPHLKVASDKAEALNNSSFPAANSIANWWATATGDPRVKTFEEVREVASMDAARLLRGSGTMAEKDIDFWRNNISSAGSPQQLQDQINTLADELMGARVESIKQQYRSVMGREPPPNWISNDAQSALSAIRARKPGAPSSSSAAPPNPVADKQALDCANANPNDPRAAQIKQRLGVQ